MIPVSACFCPCLYVRLGGQHYTKGEVSRSVFFSGGAAGSSQCSMKKDNDFWQMREEPEKEAGRGAALSSMDDASIGEILARYDINPEVSAQKLRVGIGNLKEVIYHPVEAALLLIGHDGRRTRLTDIGEDVWRRLKNSVKAGGRRREIIINSLFSHNRDYGIMVKSIAAYAKEEDMRRILLKLSGEALAGDKKTGFDEPTVRKVALQVKQLVDDGVQVGIVIGGGNFWRGRSSENIDRTKADQIGMLATVMNCIYVSEIFRSVGMMTSILTPFEVGSFTKLFSKDRANKYFSRGMVVFFAGGTGHPYFSTDTGVVLRAIEVEADVILLAKSIDAVYDDDPAKNPNAKKYDKVSIDEVIAKNLQVVDMTASILARDNKMPMRVFGLNAENSIVKAIGGDFEGTEVTV